MNVDKVLERDQKLSELDDRAGKFIILHVKFLPKKVKSLIDAIIRSIDNALK